MLGNRDHAEKGELRWYVGGPVDLVELARPVLTHLGQQVVHVGATGGGERLKLVMNLVMGLEMQTLAEAVALGEAGGLSRADVLAALLGCGFSVLFLCFLFCLFFVGCF